MAKKKKAPTSNTIALNKKAKHDERGIVSMARDADPLFNITTDVITGFPGETEQEWEETVEFVQQIGFGDIHVFPYSARQGTKAAGLPDQVETGTRKQRAQYLRSMARELKLAELNKYVGHHYPVLLENKVDKDGTVYLGYIPHFHRAETSLFQNAASNSPQTVKVQEVDRDRLVLKAELLHQLDKEIHFT